MFMKASHKDKVLNIISGLFYCEITDHMPCFLSLKFEKYNRMDERPMTRIFGEKNCAIFVQKMQSHNWNEIYDTGEETYDKFTSAFQNIYQQAFPLVRVSRKRLRDKPWLTKALKVSIKQKNNCIGNRFCIQIVFIKQNVMLTKIVYANVSWRQRKIITMNYSKIIKIPFLTSGKF